MVLCNVLFSLVARSPARSLPKIILTADREPIGKVYDIVAVVCVYDLWLCDGVLVNDTGLLEPQIYYDPCHRLPRAIAGGVTEGIYGLVQLKDRLF